MNQIEPLCRTGGAKFDDFPVTREWMQQCITVARRRESEGFMGRSFVDHRSISKFTPEAIYEPWNSGSGAGDDNL